MPPTFLTLTANGKEVLVNLQNVRWIEANNSGAIIYFGNERVRYSSVFVDDPYDYIKGKLAALSCL